MPNTKKKPDTGIGEIDIFSRGEIAEKMREATSKAPVVETRPAPKAVPADVAAKEKPASSRPRARAVSKRAVSRTETPVVTPSAPAVEVGLAPRKTSRVVTVPSENTKNVPLRFRIPSDLKGEWSGFMGELSAALGGVSLDDSNIGRPLIELLLVDYRERIIENAEAIKGTLKRPALADRLAMAEFDEEIGQVLKKSITQRRRKSLTE